ncbi:MAG: FixH family protein [Bacteroidales bacterium]
MKFNWGHGILLFMILFLLLSIAFIIFSLNQSEDLVSDDYYEQGAGYSKQIEINKRSSVYIDSINVNPINSGIIINLCKSLASSGDTLYIHFYRPSDKKADLKIKSLMSDEISIPSTELKSGRFLVKMSWNHAGNSYNIQKDILLK